MVNYIETQLELGITSRQHLFLYFIYEINTLGNTELVKLLKQYIKELGVIEDGKKRFLSAGRIEELIDKQLLVVVDDKRTLSSFKATKKFADTVVTPYTAFMQLLRAYPSFAYINGVNIPLKKCKIPELTEKYGEIVKHDPRLHNKILRLVNTAKNYDSVAWMNISNFIDSHGWIGLEEIIDIDDTQIAKRTFHNDEDF